MHACILQKEMAEMMRSCAQSAWPAFIPLIEFCRLACSRAMMPTINLHAPINVCGRDIGRVCRLLWPWFMLRRYGDMCWMIDTGGGLLRGW